MPAGDGATRSVDEAVCKWCGDALACSMTVRVDDWTAFACQGCAAAGTGRSPSLPPPVGRVAF